jgi:predicted enzyme related to lactoylglutathione lyase
MPRPVHFEIQASDPEKLRPFYENLFGWRFQRWGEIPYWLISTAAEDGDTSPGIDGALLPRPVPGPADGQAVNAFVVTVEVPDCAGYFRRALDEGATEAVPVQAVPGVGWLAYIKDPDGNILGLMQNDSSAS